MKKDLMKLVVNGFIKGVFIGYIITIIISSVVAGGEYVPCVPEFSSGYSNEIIPMVIQSILCGILGAIFMVANLIWRVDKWSLLKQTVVYLSITIGSILLIGNYLKWTKI